MINFGSDDGDKIFSENFVCTTNLYGAKIQKITAKIT